MHTPNLTLWHRTEFPLCGLPAQSVGNVNRKTTSYSTVRGARARVALTDLASTHYPDSGMFFSLI